MKHCYTFVLAAALSLVAAVSASADTVTRRQLADYAASLKGKKKADLKTAIYNLLKDKKVLSYGSGSQNTWWGFYSTDRDPKTNECINRYSSQKFYFGSRGKAISGMNIEHSFPKSWWGGAKNDAYKDLYNLYPSDSKANSSKSNYPMATVTNVKTEDPGYDKVGTGTVDGKSGTQCWEPGDQYKGDFSRGYMYMAVTYSDLTYTSTGTQTMYANASGYPGMRTWATTLYCQWSRLDQVDSLEVARNNAVSDIQGNRNLFVDFPYLCEYVWGDSVDVAFNPDLAITTASDDNRYGNYSPSDPDNPNTPDDPDNPDEGQYIFVKLTTQPTAGKRYLIVANANGSLLAAKTIASGKTYDYLKTDAVTATADRITLATDANAFTFEEAGTGFIIKGSDGRYYYNDKSHKNFNASATAPAGNIWTVSNRGDGTFTISNGSNFIQYSISYSSFGAYTSAQSSAVYPSLYEEQPTATGIESAITVKPTAQPEAVYTLQGIRVDTTRPLQPGIYIRGGKKFVQR